MDAGLEKNREELKICLRSCAEKVHLWEHPVQFTFESCRHPECLRVKRLLEMP